VALGYIAAESSHAKGTAVDITLLEPAAGRPQSAGAATAGGAGGACTAPAHLREPDDSVDMGTGYDCFDTLSHTRSTLIGPGPAAHRRILVEAMTAEGFESYANEWWHFTYVRARGPTPPHDFPVSAP
jgi:D-alanyl-D-alanine dipeptidase